MAKKMNYLKMGPKSPGFADPKTLVHLSGKEVIQVANSQLKAPKVAKAILGGHLSVASEEEYNAWVKFEASTRVGPTASLEVKNAALKDENKTLLDKIAELEANQTKAPEKEGPTFGTMNSKALVKYYKDTYELSDEEIAKFEEMEIADKRKTLEDLED